MFQHFLGSGVHRLALQGQSLDLSGFNDSIHLQESYDNTGLTCNILAMVEWFSSDQE